MEWKDVDVELPPIGVPIELTGDSGYIAPHDRFVISGRYEPNFRPLSPWLDSTGTCTAEMGWNPTHWRPLSRLPGVKTPQRPGQTLEQYAARIAAGVIWKCRHEKPVLGRGGPGPCIPTPVDELLPIWRKELVEILLDFHQNTK